MLNNVRHVTAPPLPPSTQVTDDGKTLLVVNMAAGELYTVDPESGEVSLVDLGGVSVHGDGMVRKPYNI